MSSYCCLAITAIVTTLFYGSAVAAPDATAPLTLQRAEELALARHPELAARAAQIDAARANAVASGELPDPQLKLGVQNLPTDSFALNRDGMSMVTLGVAQMFPPVGQRALTQRGAEQETAAARAERSAAQARIRRDVRRAWLDVFYLDRALETNTENRAFVAQMTAAELARYRTGTSTQTDVLKSALERDALLDEQQDLQAQRSAAASRLARLLDSDDGELRVADQLPALPVPPAAQALLHSLNRHPQIQALEAQRRAAGYETAAARRAYYPELGVEASYGYRAARDTDGSKLPDMLSAELVMSVPLFPEKRQDARLQERAAREQAARYQRDDALLELRAETQARLAEHDRLQDRLALLEHSRLPKAEQAVHAALAEYRSGRTTLAEVLALLHQRHQYALTVWRLQTDLALNTADLDYLAATAAEDSNERH